MDGGSLDLDGGTDARTDTCEPGESRPCHPGPASLAGIGACTYGTQRCVARGEFGAWGECTGAGSPSSEICDNGRDDDCDGQIDEGCPVCKTGGTFVWNVPTGTLGGPACIRTGGGTCTEALTECSDNSCRAKSCGMPHCGTLRCNDGSLTQERECSVIVKCAAAGLTATGFTW